MGIGKWHGGNSCLYMQSNWDRPLLTPRREEAEMLEKQQEDSLVARMKMFVHLRQDLERVSASFCHLDFSLDFLTWIVRVTDALHALLEKPILFGVLYCNNWPNLKHFLFEPFIFDSSLAASTYSCHTLQQQKKNILLLLDGTFVSNCVRIRHVCVRAICRLHFYINLNVYFFILHIYI